MNDILEILDSFNAKYSGTIPEMEEFLKKKLDSKTLIIIALKLVTHVCIATFLTSTSCMALRKIEFIRHLENNINLNMFFGSFSFFLLFFVQLKSIYMVLKEIEEKGYECEEEIKKNNHLLFKRFVIVFATFSIIGIFSLSLFLEIGLSRNTSNSGFLFPILFIIYSLIVNLCTNEKMLSYAIKKNKNNNHI